jgi:hypothetical protein
MTFSKTLMLQLGFYQMICYLVLQDVVLPRSDEEKRAMH